MAKMAQADGNRVTQYQSDAQNSTKKTIMQMPMDYLEIPEPALPRGFLQLAEEARNVTVQGAGLIRPVFITVMDYSLSELKEGAMIAPGISTEMIPTSLSAGRRGPVDQLGLVGPQDNTEQSVLPALDTKEVGNDPNTRLPIYEGHIEYMEWGSEDMTDTDDSEWEDPDEREKRLYVERYNFDLIEGMTNLTYTPPTRMYQRRRYEDRVKYGPELQESTSCTSELESQTDEESLNSEPTVQPGTVADEDIPTHMGMREIHMEPMS